MRHDHDMKRTDFYYELPKEFIAQYPLNDRSNSRLLILSKRFNSIENKRFNDIVDYLSENDLLVLNNTKVIPARLYANKETGGKIEIFLLNQNKDGTWQALLRPSNRVKKDALLRFNRDDIVCHVLDEPGRQAERVVCFNTKRSFWEILDKIGEIPLPPYIKRNPREEDTITYQTVFAKDRGAVASPTAGLHFTPSLLQKIKSKGVEIVFITLHINYGTFRPVKADNISNHKMHKELYEIKAETAHTINKAKKLGKRIIACGTTTVRALESAVNKNGEIEAKREYTDIFIYPPYKFKTIDALITNFHLPESTLLMLVSAFAGREQILNAYEVAKKKGYRFFSYGDAMLII